MTHESKPPTQTIQGFGLSAPVRFGAPTVSQRTYLSRRHLATARRALELAREQERLAGECERLILASEVAVAVTFATFGVEAVAYEAILGILEHESGGHYFAHIDSSLVASARAKADSWLRGQGSTIREMPNLLAELKRPSLSANIQSEMSLLCNVRNKLVHAAPGDTRPFLDATLRRKQVMELEEKLGQVGVPCVSKELSEASPGGAQSRWPDKWMCAGFADWSVQTAEAYLNDFERSLGVRWW